jgi:large subunit ribosomal protein L24e
MARCSFCGQQIIQGRGIIYVENSGRILNFCSSKCRKNRMMGREAKKMKWIQKLEAE